MSISTTGSFRQRLGVWTPADLTDAYEIEQWATQPDQPTHIEWTEPIDPSDVVSPVGEFIEGLDGSVIGFGGFELAWYLSMLTPGMVEYALQTKFFPGGVFHAVHTIMTRDRSSYTAHWRVLVVTAQYPDVRVSAEPLADGFYRMKIPFIAGEAAGRAFSDAFSSGFA